MGKQCVAPVAAGAAGAAAAVAAAATEAFMGLGLQLWQRLSWQEQREDLFKGINDSVGPSQGETA